MPTLLVLTFVLVTAYPLQRVNGEVCEGSFVEMKRADAIEGYLSHSQVHAIQTHYQECENEEPYFNAIQRCQHTLLRFCQWVCAGFL